MGPPRWNVATSIEILSDDVCLEIFDLCLDKDEYVDPWYVLGDEEDERHSYDAWYALAHVCQRWRYVVFVIATSPEFATSMSKKKMCQGDVEYLASFPYCYLGHCGSYTGRG